MGPALLGSGYSAPGFVGSCSRVRRSFLLGNPSHRSLFRVDLKAHAKAATIREFYAGGLQSASERSDRGAVGPQDARRDFEALDGRQRYP